jgi:glycerol-3-phosphate acyltransferase PlsY
MQGGLRFLLYAFLPAYGVGSVPFGYVVGRLNGIDIRKQGSGNIGATNVWRVLGKKWGIPTFILDFLKVWIAAWIVLLLDPALLDHTVGRLLILLGAVIGHNFPVWLKFKGGKGIATSAGGLLWLLPGPFLVVAVVWGIVFAIFRYVSLASILGAVALPVAVFFFRKGEWMLFWFCFCLSLLAIWRHRQNIERLIKGTEHGWKKKADEK